MMSQAAGSVPRASLTPSLSTLYKPCCCQLLQAHSVLVSSSLKPIPMIVLVLMPGPDLPILETF